jgi:hypothetical protein
MKYIDALKEWNNKKNNGMYCTPLKGSKEHAEVIAIQNKAAKAKDATKVASNVLKGAIKRKMTKQFEPATPAKPKATSAPSKIAKAAPAKPAKKPDDNLLHNLPTEIQKKIMGMARPPMWDKEGVSINSYTTDADKFLYDNKFISYLTKTQDPSGEKYYEMVQDILNDSSKKNKGDIRYRWTDEKYVKNKQYKKLIERAKKRANKDFWGFNENSRVIMFFLNNDEDYLYSFIETITNKDEPIYKTTYGVSNVEP